MSDAKSLENLQAWRKSVDFAKRIYSEVLPILPKEEKWAMANQLRRASQSIAANIAEGYGRYYYQESIRFCYIARGSLEECFTFLTLAHELEYIPEPHFGSLRTDILELHRIINGYVAYLKRSKRGQNEPGAESSIREIPPDYHLVPDVDEPDP